MAYGRRYIIFLFILITSVSFAQEPTIQFNHLSTGDGLSNGNITAIAQDSSGFVWLGTQQGLNRFDGYDFKKFYAMPGAENILPDDNITSLSSSPDTILWIGTDSKGLVSYNPITDRFTQYKILLYNPDDDNYPRIIKVYCDEQGSIWLSTDDGRLLLINYSQRNSVAELSSVKVVHNYTTDKNIGINDFCFIAERKLLVGTDAGLYLLEYDDNFKVIKNDLLFDEAALKVKVIENNIFAITDFEQRKVYSSKFYPDKIDPADFNFTRFYPDPENRSARITDIISHKNKTLFVLDPFQLIGYSQDLNTIIFEQNLASLFNNINQLRIYSLFIDKSSSLWGLTNGLGAVVEQSNQKIFSTLKHNPNDPNSISPTSLRQLVEDPHSGEIWITGYDGISLYEPYSKTVRSYPFNRFIYSLALLKKHKNYFLLGTDGQGLYLGNKQTGETNYLNLVYSDKSILKNGNIFFIYVDPKDNVWLSSLEGLMKFRLPDDLENIPTKIDIQLTSLTYNKKEISSKISQIFPVSDSLFYLTTANSGIIKYNITDDTYTALKYEPDYPKSISGNNVKIIFPASDGNYWVGTTRGLNKWLKDDFINFRNNFQRILTSDGLPNNVIYGILEDNNRNLWLSTNLGLSRFNPDKFTFDNFSVKDGLANEEFNTNSYLKSSTGEMYLGGIYGLTYFNPESIAKKKAHQNVVFTNLSILNKDIKTNKNITYAKNIELQSSENVFTVSFAALDYQNLGRVEYNYQLAGEDSTWIDLGKTRNVTFTNVSPGDYKLRVRSKTSFTNWSDDIAELSITILPPIWQTWWMYSIYVIILLLGFAILIRYEQNRQRHKQDAEIEKLRVENLLEIDKAKSNFFANISHELRTPLTLVLGMLESIKSVVKTKYADSEIDDKINIAYKGGQKQLEMVNQILNLTKIDAGEEEFNASVANIVPLIRIICSSFESLAELNKLKLNFTTDYEIIPVNYDVDKIEKVMNNLLSNAIKFTPGGGEISVSIKSGLSDLDFQKGKIESNKEAQRFVQILVNDSGVGIIEEKLTHIFDRFFQADDSGTKKYEGVGIGLSLTKELVTLHNGEIKAESVPGEGSTFTISLPIDFNSLIGEVKNPDYKLTPVSEETKEINITSEPTEKTGSNSILVIEDNSDLRYFISDTLKSSYNIFEAQDGKEGIELAESEIPDLIITDAMMPNMDGFEMTKILREKDATSHIPIIMVTAKAAEEDRLSGLDAGVDAYLTKPFSTKELFLRVKKLLELREKLYKKIGEGAFVNPLELKINSTDRQFLSKLKETVTANIGNENFSVEELAGEMAMGVRQLRRKLNALIDISPSGYVRKLRLMKARDLLLNKNGNVSQVCLEVGYSNFAAFSKAFKDEFGIPPSQIISK